MDEMPEKLSFILPIAIHESGVSDDGELSWRHNVDQGTLIRSYFLLSSFVRAFHQDDLEEFLIICPEKDIPRLSNLLKSITSDCRYKFVPELDICRDILKATDPKSGEVIGWTAQQLIKLAIATHIRTDYYVALDSDIFCVKPFSAASLIQAGLAITNLETVDDYRRIYSDDFYNLERYIKARRYRHSAKLIGYKRPHDRIARFYGETPVVLNTVAVIDLTSHIESRFDQRWSSTLATSKLEWTEYGLYFQFLEMTERFELVCRTAGCNSILDLEKSVWQDSSRYRLNRRYDKHHFTHSHAMGNMGYFIALQSWLPTASWLPKEFNSLDEFYRNLYRWIFKADPIRL